MVEPEHSKIIAQAAKDALSPLGFRRKGRSRVWLADHGCWLGVVEFQPSGFSKGSYLNVSAHWLWKPPPYSLTFDYFHPDQTRPFIEFVDAAQFTPLAAEQADQAARDCDRLARLLADMPAIATALANQQQAWRRAGWPTFHAAVAAGLIGDAKGAKELFSAFSESLGGRFVSVDDWVVQATKALKTGDFAVLVRRTVSEARAALKLPTWLGDY
jgi:hypothetical protein